MQKWISSLIPGLVGENPLWVKSLVIPFKTRVGEKRTLNYLSLWKKPAHLNLPSSWCNYFSIQGDGKQREEVFSMCVKLQCWFTPTWAVLSLTHVFSGFWLNDIFTSGPFFHKWLSNEFYLILVSNKCLYPTQWYLTGLPRIKLLQVVFSDWSHVVEGFNQRITFHS